MGGCGAVRCRYLIAAAVTDGVLQECQCAFQAPFSSCKLVFLFLFPKPRAKEIDIVLLLYYSQIHRKIASFFLWNRLWLFRFIVFCRANSRISEIPSDGFKRKPPQILWVRLLLLLSLPLLIVHRSYHYFWLNLLCTWGNDKSRFGIQMKKYFIDQCNFITTSKSGPVNSHIMRVILCKLQFTLQ